MTLLCNQIARLQYKVPRPTLWEIMMALRHDGCSCGYVVFFSANVNISPHDTIVPMRPTRGIYKAAGTMVCTIQRRLLRLTSKPFHSPHTTLRYEILHHLPCLRRKVSLSLSVPTILFTNRCAALLPPYRKLKPLPVAQFLASLVVLGQLASVLRVSPFHQVVPAHLVAGMCVPLIAQTHGVTLRLDFESQMERVLTL